MDPSSASPSARHDETTPLLPQNFHDDQSKSLPRKQLLVVIPVLSFVHFISFLDQMIISTSLPAIAAALSSGAFTSWVGTSFLVTSTSVQLLNGRLSDIFGRKTCLITALTVMSIGNLLCGFSRAHWQLCASRALTGFGAGALNTLVQVTISDLTRLHQRGYYFGTLGVAVALGNGLGPVVVGILVEKAGWRWAFWFICPLTFGAIALLALVLSESPSTRDFRGRFKMIDWLGVRESMLGIIALLVSQLRSGQRKQELS